MLVPHDFSAAATEALKVAAQLAARARGRLIVIHAIVPFYAVPGFPPTEQAAWISPAELVEEARHRLETVVVRALGRRRTPVVEYRVVIGDPFQVILATAPRADAIVMATTGRTGLKHLLIGSVAEKVVRHAPVPVLTICASTRAARGAAAVRRTRRR